MNPDRRGDVLNSKTNDVNRLEAQSHLNSNNHDVNRLEAQSHLISNMNDVNPDPREDAPHAPGATQSSEQTRQGLPDSPTTVVDPELPRHGKHAQSTAHAHGERIPPSPTTLLVV